MSSRAVLPCLVLALAACGRDRPKAPPPAPAPASEAPPAAPPVVATRGQELVGALKQRLRGELSKALAGGTAGAIDVCGRAAKAIADELSTGGATVGRATHKPRNPANAATGWQAEALAEFEALAAAGKPLDGAHYLRQLPDGHTRYAEPLVVQALCEKCHGAAIEPDVAARLAAAYPTDQATGYHEGDLRGVVWTEYTAAR